MRIAEHIALLAAYGIACAAIGFLLLYIHLFTARPDLQPWHLAELKYELRAERAAEVPDLGAYMCLEERLFRDLDEKICVRVL